MHKKTKIWIIVALCLVAAGCAVFGAVMAELDGDFTKLSTTEYVTNTYDIGENFSSIDLDTDTADITFALSADGKCVVECFEEKNAGHKVEVKEGTLHIRRFDERSLFEYIGINMDSSRIKISLPQAQYDSLIIRGSTGDVEMPGDFSFGDVDVQLSTGHVRFAASAKTLLKIKVSTGDITLEDVSAETLDLSVSTGKTFLTDVRCADLVSGGATGDITLKNVVATGKMSITRSTGDICFDACDAAQLFLETDTGDVKGSLLTQKIFFVEADTGSVDIPESRTGGECRVSTDTGDVRITLY